MSNVIDLSLHRAKRARSVGDDVRAKPPDQIQIQWRQDGSYEVTISGIYAASLPTAVHHLADVISRLAPRIPH